MIQSTRNFQSISEVYYNVMRYHCKTLRFETQEMSLIEALYFTSLIRRLLTQEQVGLGFEAEFLEFSELSLDWMNWALYF